ncbi:MAG: hypothetical protein IH596_06995 [Bacteroidales bacterium]|nr:hypothetical protein [Bacteroidales bacterium]
MEANQKGGNVYPINFFRSFLLPNLFEDLKERAEIGLLQNECDSIKKMFELLIDELKGYKEHSFISNDLRQSLSELLIVYLEWNGIKNTDPGFAGKRSYLLSIVRKKRNSFSDKIRPKQTHLFEQLNDDLAVIIHSSIHHNIIKEHGEIFPKLEHSLRIFAKRCQIS